MLMNVFWAHAVGDTTEAAIATPPTISPVMATVSIFLMDIINLQAAVGVSPDLFCWQTYPSVTGSGSPYPLRVVLTALVAH